MSKFDNLFKAASNFKSIAQMQMSSGADPKVILSPIVQKYIFPLLNKYITQNNFAGKIYVSCNISLIPDTSGKKFDRGTSSVAFIAKLNNPNSPPDPIVSDAISKAASKAAAQALMAAWEKEGAVNMVSREDLDIAEI